MFRSVRLPEIRRVGCLFKHHLRLLAACWHMIVDYSPWTEDFQYSRDRSTEILKIVVSTVFKISVEQFRLLIVLSQLGTGTKQLSSMLVPESSSPTTLITSLRPWCYTEVTYPNDLVFPEDAETV